MYKIASNIIKLTKKMKMLCAKQIYIYICNILDLSVDTDNGLN